MPGWLFPEVLAPGTPAPPFELPDQDGHLVSLASLAGSNVVLVFYPGDDTFVCTRQLCEFRDQWAAAQARNTKVFGVNPQKQASHAAFRQKYNLPFPLLVDAGQHVASAYHAKGLIVRRTVYLVGASGLIRYARRGKPSPAEVLAAAE